MTHHESYGLKIALTHKKSTLLIAIFIFFLAYIVGMSDFIHRIKQNPH